MKKIQKPKFFNFNLYPETNGTLVPFYSKKHFPKNFKLKRFFILYGKKNYFRADHAHSKCSQIIIPLKGVIKVKVKSKNFSKIYKLSLDKKKGIFIPPYNWVTLFFKNNDDTLLILCNYKYDKKEYISVYEKFKKIISK